MSRSHVVKISTNASYPCPRCGEFQLDGTSTTGFNKACDHMINEHDFTLQHVGTETMRGSNGEPWQTTVAVLKASMLDAFHEIREENES